MTDGDRPVDVVVVGLGAAGALAAWVLAEAGASVVGLEAGGWPPAGRPPAPGPARSGPDERPAVRRRASGPARPDPSSAVVAELVGGSKHLSAGQSYRLADWSLRIRSAVTAHHGPGGLPPDATTTDWPLGPEDLRPYHERVERLFAVAGAPAGTPPLPPTPWTTRMHAAADRLGWAPFAAPAAVAGPDHRPAVLGRDLLGPAVRSGALVVRTEARAIEVALGRDGTAAGVRYVHEGRERLQPARAVVLAAWVPGNVRLLLLSRPPGHPAGLGNAHDQVGRHYATHSLVTARGLFPGIDLGRGAGTAAQSVATTAFDGDAFAPPARRGVGPDDPGGGPGPDPRPRPSFVGGSVLQASMGVDPARAARALGLPAEAGPSIGSVWAQPEQLTREAHRLDLDPDRRDGRGRPLLRATHDLADDDRRRAAFLQDRMQTWLREAGATTTWRSPVVPWSVATHSYGGTRMGTDPRTSVVDADGSVHDVPGLVVLGASTFPSTGGRGPTQTVEALAWRSAELLAERLRR
jgi:gluconate 2-dehydrogenase alpha chain